MHDHASLAPPTRGSKHGNGNNNGSNTNSSSKRMTTVASQWAGTLLQSTKHTVQSWTVRKYTLPDKHVASQVLMYRQLLHTACRPGLTLSREYQGTPAQQAVLHMPWWSQGILQTHKMIISYQNLLARLWIAGAVTPYGEDWRAYHHHNNTATAVTEETSAAASDLAMAPTTTASTTDEVDTTAATKTDHPNTSAVEEKKDVEASDHTTTTTINDKDATDLANDNLTPEQARFRAPVPHRHWVDRLGFQQEDPVTDFRSGGILSLAMMVHLVESCPETHRRFYGNGDAAVLPFALTCINITDMMAKFLMLSKAVDRMDALLSQKPFWRMFADPYALLVCQETAMEVTANVVVELEQERQRAVTVFDFAHVLAMVERRMEYDYLMAGPTTCAELRQIHVKNQVKYQQQLEQRLRLRAKAKEEEIAAGASTVAEGVASTTADEGAGAAAPLPPPTATVDDLWGNGVAPLPPPPAAAAAVGDSPSKVHVWKHRAASVAGNVWQKVKAPGFTKVQGNTSSSSGGGATSSSSLGADEKDNPRGEERRENVAATTSTIAVLPPASSQEGEEEEDFILNARPSEPTAAVTAAEVWTIEDAADDDEDLVDAQDVQL
ncbi:hypothetical protein ACA910_018906 [Epithemia clementina (nom. ined.)]